MSSRASMGSRCTCVPGSIQVVDDGAVDDGYPSVEIAIDSYVLPQLGHEISQVLFTKMPTAKMGAILETYLAQTNYIAYFQCLSVN